MRTRLFKTSELNGSSYVKIPLTSSALISNKNDDKHCFIWSILAKLHTCEKIIVTDFQIIENFSDEQNFKDFDFTKAYKCSDVYEFEKLISLSFKIFE